jgi:hypothetical protein
MIIVNKPESRSGFYTELINHGLTSMVKLITPNHFPSIDTDDVTVTVKQDS